MDIIDSITGFLSWYDAARSLLDTEKILTFKSQVCPLDRTFYDFRFRGITERGENVDSKILAIFNEFSSISERFIFLYSNLMADIEKGLKLFNNMFPDFVIDTPFHICHSLSECDGDFKIINGKKVMVLGIDVMAQVHNWDNEVLFVQHELFHIYHRQLYPHSNISPYHEDTIARGLWTEGLAVYISYLLNPSASYTDLTLDIPHNMVPETEKLLVEISKDLLKNIHSNDSEIYDQYFLIRSTPATFPYRCGYYVGYLIVKQMAQTYPLDKLIRLPEKDFVPELISNLELIIQNRS